MLATEKNPLIMRPWQLERVTEPLRPMIDEWIAKGWVVIDTTRLDKETRT